MTVTIIGSIKSKEKIEEAITFANTVLKANVIHHPLDNIQELPLLKIQSRFIKYISDSDLVIVCPKFTRLQMDGGTDQTYTIGESTTYEMATAKFFGRPILIWGGKE